LGRWRWEWAFEKDLLVQSGYLVRISAKRGRTLRKKEYGCGKKNNAQGQ